MKDWTWLHDLKLYSLPVKTDTVDLQSTVLQQLRPLLEHSRVQGKKIGIAVGSRNIASECEILHILIRELRTYGASVCIIPAMGSHGGATAEGQSEVLALKGITERQLGVPVVSAMKPVRYMCGTSPVCGGEVLDIYIDAHAVACDAMILVNRIKPHTSFVGPIQSGLCKMACIGLGKAVGASYYHRLFSRYGFQHVLPELVARVTEHIPIIAGIALIENGTFGLSHIEVLPPQDWIEQEPRLLRMSVENMPNLPFGRIDMLIIDEIGKAVSGSGMDTNVVGLKRDIFSCEVGYRYVRSLAKGSGGNAVGMGLADVIHKRLLADVDFSVSYINAETSLSPNAVKIPITYGSDRQALESLFRMGGFEEGEKPIVVWIRNTSDLQYIVTNVPSVSNPEVGKPLVIDFDRHGNLPNFAQLILGV